MKTIGQGKWKQTERERERDRERAVFSFYPFTLCIYLRHCTAKAFPRIETREWKIIFRVTFISRISSPSGRNRAASASFAKSECGTSVIKNERPPLWPFPNAFDHRGGGWNAREILEKKNDDCGGYESDTFSRGRSF